MIPGLLIYMLPVPKRGVAITPFIDARTICNAPLQDNLLLLYLLFFILFYIRHHCALIFRFCNFVFGQPFF
jgi:hypothetical protein